MLEKQDIPSEEVLVSREDKIISNEHELDNGDVLEVFKVIAGG